MRVLEGVIRQLETELDAKNRRIRELEGTLRDMIAVANRAGECLEKVLPVLAAVYDKEAVTKTGAKVLASQCALPDGHAGECMPEVSEEEYRAALPTFAAPLDSHRRQELLEREKKKE